MKSISDKSLHALEVKLQVSALVNTYIITLDIHLSMHYSSKINIVIHSELLVWRRVGLSLYKQCNIWFKL